MRDHICSEEHPEVHLRCWKRAGHEGQHLTVLPNVDPGVRTKPVPARW